MFRKFYPAVLSTAALIAGCSGAGHNALSPVTPQSNSYSNDAIRAGAARPLSASFGVIHSFRGPDGAKPVAELTVDPARNGMLFGTTTAGGVGAGTVFEVSAFGKDERVLHAFSPDAPDFGVFPAGGVVALFNVDGTRQSTLIGTAQHGGLDSRGIVYEMTAANGIERVLHTFQGRPSDGTFPASTLLRLGDAFYGAARGGKFGNGIVYEVTLDGTERIVHDFDGTPDGDRPVGGLVVLDNAIYGATRMGGTRALGCVYEVDANDNERVLYSFTGRAGDGESPEAGLVALNDTLFGTTRLGGETDHGTVFALSTNGVERVLHSFTGPDGSFPRERLTVMNGKLYGTTEFGGFANAGTVFELQLDGKMRVLHEFDGGAGGKFPRSALTELQGNLYGTTFSGGTQGRGTIFATRP
jgi:uncharacterized repeat protein (TIGR03803 family)